MKLYIVGAGPGAPDLITVRGRNLIARASIVIYAGSLVSPEHLAWAPPEAERYDSSSMTLEEVVEVYERESRREGVIVRLHTGDPSIYGAVQEQIDWCEAHGIPFEVVPGVSSVSAAAATLKRELTLPGVTQTVILSRISGRTPVPEAEALSELGKIGASLCLFLSIGAIDRVVAELTPVYGEDTPVAVVFRAGWKDETVITGTLDSIAQRVTEAGITRQAIIIVGRIFDGHYQRSKLYDGGFTHGYRKRSR